MRSPAGLGAVAVALLLIACARDEGTERRSAAGGEVIARYAGKTLTSEEFRREVERLPPRARGQLTSPERKRQFLDNLIMRELLAEEGRGKGYERDPEIERQVDELRQRLVVQRVMKDLQEPPELDEEEVRSYYEQNRRLFSGAQVHARHILVKDEALAERLRDALRADPSQFEDLARQHSTDTATAPRGGDLGFFGQGRMVGEFERAAFVLEHPGDISGVVKTSFGYHLIQLIERKDVPDKPFDEVRDRIRITLMNQRRQAQMSERLDALRAEAGVEVDDDALAEAAVPGATGPSSAAPAGPPGSAHAPAAPPVPAVH